MKANIKKTSPDFNNKYFAQRDDHKNALAISSDQSKVISSYEDVEMKYLKSFKSNNLNQCPEYWGGFSFIPYYFEFWEGHKSRLNKREVYEIKENKWTNFILQP